MKNFKALRIIPLDGESKADAVARTVKQLISDLESGKEPQSLEDVSLEDLVKESNGDDCDCPVCQIRRKVEGFLGQLDKKQESGAIKNPSVVESAMNLMSEEESTNNLPYLIDDKEYNFSQILESMKNGYRVIRGDWPSVMSIGITDEKGDDAGQPIACENHIAQLISIDEDNFESYHYVLPYQLTSADILATDWRILKYKI